MPKKKQTPRKNSDRLGAPEAATGLVETEHLAKPTSSPAFVVVSDLHAHPWAAFAKGDGTGNSRLRRTLEVLRASLERAQHDGIPWVFAGDIVHTAGYALNVVLAELVRVLGSYPDVRKFVVWGNHDSRGVGGRIVLEQTVWAALVKAVPNLVVLEPHVVMHENGLTFSGAGAQPKLEAFTYAAESDVGVYHGTVRGSIGPNGHVFTEGLDPQELLRRHRIAIVGDIHHPQQIEAPPGSAILIPGSPEHHNFGDAESHGWWVVAADENPSVEFVDSGSPEFRTVDSPRQVRPDGNFYRVRNMPVGVGLPDYATAIAPAPTTVQARDVLRGKHGDEILAAWLEEDPPSGAIADYLTTGRFLMAAQEPRQLRAIRLTRLFLQNFCSHDNTQFEVRDGIWLVLGRGRDFPSNGAGKSTLFEALFWLLFGRTTKGLTGDEVIRWGTDQCIVVGEFVDHDGNVLSVIRRRGEASTLDVQEGDLRWEATSVNEMTEKLTRWLGLTPELFQALGYFSQERLLLFASATDGERKEMLADLISLGAYQAASAAAGSGLERNRSAQGTLTARWEMAQGQVNAEAARLEALEAHSVVWEAERNVRLEKAKAEIEEFLTGQQEYREQLLTMGRGELTGSMTLRRNALLEQERDLKARIDQTGRICTPERFAAAQAEHLAAREHGIGIARSRETLDTQLSTARRKLAAADGLLSKGICPTCNQSISQDQHARCLEPYQATCQELEAQINDFITQEPKAKKRWDAAVRALEAAEQGMANMRAFDTQTAQLKEVRASLAQLAKEAGALEEHVTAHVDGVLTTKRNALAEAAAQIRREKNPLIGEVTATKERITAAQTTAAKYAEELASLQGEEVILDYWHRGFSKQGIQSLLVDEVAALFNGARGTIFPVLTQGVYDVQFSTTSRTKAGEWRERTEFQVLEHGQPIPYAALSGGQRRRIDVGVMLVLVKAVSEWMRVPGVLGLLVLDEVFGFLDASGTEGLMEALREVQVQIPSVYAVSHDPQLQALFPDVITVEQDEHGVSQIAGA